MCSEFLTHSSTWDKPLLEKIKNQYDYEQKIKSWNPVDAPKKIRIEKSERMLEKIKLKTERDFAARKKMKVSKEPAFRLSMITPNTAHSKIAASDGGGSYPITGAVSGTLKIPVNPKKLVRKRN